MCAKDINKAHINFIPANLFTNLPAKSVQVTTLAGINMSRKGSILLAILCFIDYFVKRI
jgi:hypothetical protein